MASFILRLSLIVCCLSLLYSAADAKKTLRGIGFVPVETEAPVGTEVPVKTETPVETEAPVSPVETEAPVAPVETEAPVAPVETEAPVAPVETEAPVAPVETEAPVAPVETEAPVAPVETEAPVAPVETEAPVAPIVTEAPTELKNIAEIAAADDDLSILLEVVRVTGLTSVISSAGPFTVFAPTNSAFMEVVSDVDDLDSVDTLALATLLTYHVVPGIHLASDITDGLLLTTFQGETIEFHVEGDVVTVNEKVISATDIAGSNGVIHKIDGIMFPQAVLATEATEAPATEETPGTIADLAMADPDLSMLLKVIELAGFASVISSVGPFTVFAPTNSAFAEVVPNTDDLDTIDTLTLATLVMYHVVPGIHLASDITDGLLLTTVQGETIEFHVEGDVVTVNEEVISATDIAGSNGVIHKVDGVMFPQAVLDPEE